MDTERALSSAAHEDRADADAPAPLELYATPLAWVWTTVVLGCAFFILQTMLAVDVPTLGVELEAGGDDSGLRVARVFAELPADRAGVREGDVLVSLSVPGRELALRDHLTLNDPDVAGSYAMLNAFQRDVRALNDMLSGGPVTLRLSDGRELVVIARDSRPLNMLPGWYWAISLMGVVALAIGVALKAHTPGDHNTTLVLVAAVGFWLTAWSWPLYGPRELATPLPDLLATLEHINHLGFVVMIGAALALLWQYPVRLGPGRLWPLTLGIGALIWLSMTLQWFEFPLHAFYVPLFCLPLVVALALAALQWRASRDRPLEKAALRWLLISMFGSTCGAFAMYVVPPLYGLEPLTPPWVSQLILLVFFVGLALGAARYRLFDVERWWVNTWIWFGMGVAIILIDVALITFLQLGAAGSTILAVVVVGWLYFPLRQWIWQRVAQTPDRSPWQIMPQIASSFSRPLGAPELARELGRLFESIFDAPDAVILETNAPDDRPRLANHGLNLVIPAPRGAGQVFLSGKHRGLKLFNFADVNYAHTVTRLVDQMVGLAQEHDAVERTERERIMRDLHDDVGARLLSLIHGTPDPFVREEAADLLQTLRTSVIPLHNRRSTKLAEAASRWRAELAQRTARAGVRMHWRESLPDTLHLGPRQYVNLTRILRELLTNALKHARPQNVWIELTADDALSVAFANDGVVSDPAQWSPGRGQHNLATRAREIHGQLRFDIVREDDGDRLRALLTVAV